MQDSMNFLERVLAWLLLPTTIYGAGGAILHSVRKRRSPTQAVLEAFGGIITTNMLGPVIQSSAPEMWQFSLYFLVGWGGLEAVGRLYEAVVQAFEKRIQNQINPRGKDGE